MDQFDDLVEHHAGRDVRPVPVLQEQNERMVPGAQRENGGERLHQRAAEVLSGQMLRQRVCVARQRKQVQVERYVQRQFRGRLPDARDHLLDAVRRPACTDPEVFAEHVGEGQKGNGGCVR